MKALLGLVIFVGLLLVLPSIISENFIEQEVKVTFGEVVFVAEIAETIIEKQKGLSGRESLAMDSAMLFVYSKEGIYHFWMKELQFNLDIIWLDKNKEVVHIESNLSPDTYPQLFTSPIPAQYILEVNEGLASKHGVSVGSVLDFDL